MDQHLPKRDKNIQMTTVRLRSKGKAMKQKIKFEVVTKIEETGLSEMDQGDFLEYIPLEREFNFLLSSLFNGYNKRAQRFQPAKGQKAENNRGNSGLRMFSSYFGAA